MTDALLYARPFGTATLRYKQSSLTFVFGFQISSPTNPLKYSARSWTQALGRSTASRTPCQGFTAKQNVFFTSREAARSREGVVLPGEEEDVCVKKGLLLLGSW